MKILFISHRIPFPSHKADRLPVYHRLISLSRRYEVSMIFPIFHKDELGYLSKLNEWCKSVDYVCINHQLKLLSCVPAFLTGSSLMRRYFYSHKLFKKITNKIKNESFDIIYIFGAGMAQYTYHLRSLKKVIDICDVDSNKWKQYSEYASFPAKLIYRLEWQRFRAYEDDVLKDCDRVITVSEAEKRLLSKRVKNDRIDVITNGVDSNYFQPSSDTYEIDSIVFTGAMNYYPNVDGILYFYDAIWPLIQEVIPNLKLYIVGYDPTHKIRRLAKSHSVIVTGFVPDVRPYITKASVFIAPMRIAMGIQNKVLEAMACGVPAVVTNKVRDGLGVENGKGILVEDDPRGFAKAVIKLILDPVLRSRLGKLGREYVINHHCWTDQMDRLNNILYTTQTAINR